jgi:hypothetical protein
LTGSLLLPSRFCFLSSRRVSDYHKEAFVNLLMKRDT